MSDDRKIWSAPDRPAIFDRPIGDLPRDLQKLVQAVLAYADGIRRFISLAEDCVACRDKDCDYCPSRTVLQDSALFVTTSYLGVRKRQVAPENQREGDEIMDWANAWTQIALQLSRMGRSGVQLFS